MIQKIGGNVAVYFCTPDLDALHAIAGNVSAEEFVAGAEWAAELWRELRGLPKPVRRERARAAHGAMLGKDHPIQDTPLTWTSTVTSLGGTADSRIGTVATKITITYSVNLNPLMFGRALDAQIETHRLLLGRPLAPLEEVFRGLFEGILGEKVSDQEVSVVELRNEGTVTFTVEIVSPNVAVPLR